MTIVIGVLIVITVALLAVVVRVMYPPGSGVDVNIVEGVLPVPGGAGVLLIVIGAILQVTRRNRRGRGAGRF